MGKRLKIIWKKIVEWHAEDPDENLENEEFDKFHSKMERRMNRIYAAQKASTHESRAQVALMFENAYMQRKITESNNSIKTATWIMALAALGTLIGTFYGVDNLNKTLQGSLQVIALFIAVTLLLYLLKGVWKFIKFIISLVKNN